MRITRIKRCPHCFCTQFYRVLRKRWMRLFRGSALYHCARCRKRFLVLGAIRKPVEQRKKPRRAVNGALLAFNGKEPGGRELGPVIDIGPGGLSFQYVADRKPPVGSFTLHLSRPTSNLEVRNLPVTTVFDVATGETAPFSNISVRRRGLKFDAFPLPQRMKLHWLVRRCNAA